MAADGPGTGPFAVSGRFAYLIGEYGLKMFDVSNPTNCAVLSEYQNPRRLYPRPKLVAASDNRFYLGFLGDDDEGMLVFASRPNMQFISQVVATPHEPFTIETAGGLDAPIEWSRIVNEVNHSAFPFDVPDTKLYWANAKAGDI